MVAKLAVIKAEKDPLDTARLGRTFLLPDFNKYYFGNRSSYPLEFDQVIFVAPSDTTPRADNGNWREDSISIDMEIVLHSSAGDVDHAEEDLQIRTERYYRAVSEIMFANKGILSTVTDSNEIRSPVSDLRREGNELYHGCPLTFEVTKIFNG